MYRLFFVTDKIYSLGVRKTIIFYLVNFFIYSLYLISLHPLSRNGESELLIFKLQVVVDTLQKTVYTG